MINSKNIIYLRFRQDISETILWIFFLRTFDPTLVPHLERKKTSSSQFHYINLLQISSIMLSFYINIMSVFFTQHFFFQTLREEYYLFGMA